MVWGPNLGINYPFLNGGVPLPANGSANFLALDTVADGVINHLDDPYTPFYPGDAYVDWVAVSLYWYPDEGTGFNGLPDATFFADSLTATGPAIARYNPLVLNQANRNFYANFAAAKNKPMMLPETSAPFVPAITTGTATEKDIKEQWWNQIFNDQVRSNFPLLKLAIWFEEMKSDGREIRDWRATHSPATLEAFKTDFASSNRAKKVVFAENLKVQCNGRLNVDFR